MRYLHMLSLLGPPPYVAAQSKGWYHTHKYKGVNQRQRRKRLAQRRG